MSIATTSVLSCAAQVNKTLKEAKDLDGQTRSQLELAKAEGELASLVHECSTKRANTSNYTTFKTLLFQLCEKNVQPTVNVCFSWAGHCAEFAVGRRDIEKFISIMCVWSGPAPVDDGGEAGEQFDIENPSMAGLCPSTTDEDEATNFVAKDSPKPEKPADAIVYDKERAFDKYVSSFRPSYLNHWACESVYAMLKEDLESSAKFALLWLQTFDDVVLESRLSPGMCTAAHMVKQFAMAYYTVVSDTPITAAKFQAFTAVFLGQKGKPIAEFHKLLVVNCRKQSTFAKREALVAPAASTEIEHGSALLETLKEITSGNLEPKFMAECAEKITGAWCLMRSAVLMPMMIAVDAALSVILQTVIEEDDDDLEKKLRDLKLSVLTYKTLHKGAQKASVLTTATATIEKLREASISSKIKKLTQEFDDTVEIESYRLHSELDSVEPPASPKFYELLEHFVTDIVLARLAKLCHTPLDDAVIWTLTLSDAHECTRILEGNRSTVTLAGFKVSAGRVLFLGRLGLRGGRACRGWERVAGWGVLPRGPAV